MTTRQWLSVFCCIALSLPAGSGLAQHFQKLNSEFPIGPSEEVFEDAEGFLWIGTTIGLIRFDGYSVHTFKHDLHDTTSMAANNINAVGQDHSGRLWVGLRSYGVDVLDREQKHFMHLCLPDKKGECMQDVSGNAIVRAKDGQLWVGTSAGLFRFTDSPVPECTLRFYEDEEDTTSVSSDYITCLFMDSKDRLWVGSLDGVNLYDQVNGNFINHFARPSFMETQILAITEDRNGQIWVSPRFSEDCLFIYDEETGTLNPAPNFHDRTMGEFRMTFDQDNTLWISSRKTGAFRVDPISQERIFFNPMQSRVHGFTNIFGVEVTDDRTGNIWFTGTHLLKWPGSHKAIHNISSDGNAVLSVYGNAKEIRLCELTPVHIDRATWERSDFIPEDLPTNIREDVTETYPTKRIHCFRQLDDTHVVFTTIRNVFVWNITDDSFVEYPTSVGGPMREFAFTPDKQAIWIAGNQGRPIHMDLNTGETTFEEPFSQVKNARCVESNTEGDYWFGSSTHGLYRIREGSSEIIQFSPTQADPAFRLSDYYVNDIDIHGDSVWVATNMDVHLIHAKTLAMQGILSGETADETVQSLCVDDQGQVWMGTQNGLLRYIPETQEMQRFNAQDGLINTTYSTGARYKDDDGNLYFGGDQGVDYFNPKEIGINTVPPLIYLGSIRVNNIPADTALLAHHLSTLDLPYDKNYLDIELLALHLTAPHANQYAYRIPELDTTWRYLGNQRNITLANLHPGTFTLEAKAANGDDVWSGAKKLLRIHISPPFWRTWWFSVLMGLLLATIIFLTYRYRISQVRKSERLKTDFNKRIAELESRALRAQMNPHFLFNSINSVKSLISQGDNDKATQYLTRFGQLIRQVLSNSEQSMVRLQEELEALRLYLEIEELRFQNFSYTLEVAPDVNADFIEVPPLILQPYVENAIWHGLMHKTSGERKLSVTVSLDGDVLHMTVEDNGIGRKRAGQMKMLGSARKGGMGMRVTGDRLNLLQGLYGREATVEVTDLGTEAQPEGTRVVIRIPWAE